ncbi:hypothetical protein MUK42_14451 [Musa troglodytarum]|uniref:Uncharacterized protein n=1 Tax=Musa troglodytarum TaxID=320322 RepID=A0A9E7I0W2_9LILI|nr:hypothetical protein MUK42_14451 [Musa troglodytarum]
MSTMADRAATSDRACKGSERRQWKRLLSAADRATTALYRAGVLEQGPWGGKTWNMGQADHISNVKIHYIDAVFAFDFTFTVDGVTKTIHVGGGAPQYNEVPSKLKTSI